MAPSRVLSASSNSSAIDIMITVPILSCLLLLISICACCKKKTGRWKKGTPAEVIDPRHSQSESSVHAPSIILPTDAELAQDQEEAMRMLEKKSWDKKKAAAVEPSSKTASPQSPQSFNTAKEASLKMKSNRLPPTGKQVKSSALDQLSTRKASSAGSSVIKKTIVISASTSPKNFSMRTAKQISTSTPETPLSPGPAGYRVFADPEKETQYRLRIARHATPEEAAKSLKLDFDKNSNKERWAKFLEYYKLCKATAAEGGAKRVCPVKKGPAKKGQYEASVLKPGSSVTVSNTEENILPKSVSPASGAKSGTKQTKSAASTRASSVLLDAANSGSRLMVAKSDDKNKRGK